MRFHPNNSIDRKAEDLNRYMILAENIQKYPCFCLDGERYPLDCSKCGKWKFISKALKLAPKNCRRKWKTLRKHFTLGFLKNSQLIDKLQFLKDNGNEIPVNQVPNKSVSPLNTLSTTVKNPNLIVVPLVNSSNNRNENPTFKANKVLTSQLPSNPVSSSDRLLTTKENSDLVLIPIINLINDDEDHSVRANEVEVANASEHGKDIATENLEISSDSDFEIIEPYIETIVVD